VPILTPTTSGNVLAGLVVGTFQYSILVKLDKIPFIKKFISEQRKLNIIKWIVENKAISFLLFEVFNMGVHSGITDPNGAMFAGGNSIVNGVAIGVYLPWYLKKHRKESDRNVLEGV
jgi:hypothetical protein